MNYYNDNDPTAAAWLRSLVAAGRIPPGVVDDRPIEEVQGSDVEGYTQCHFFAGVGGWPLALALAGWPTARPVWTGSCPCQPFSSAGKRRGVRDERHLWPEFRRLIKERRPPICFGEQVAGAAGVEWFVGVCTDLETLGYAVGAADLCAACVGAPHIRQRLYWVADDQGERLRTDRAAECEPGGGRLAPGRADAQVAIRLGDADGGGSQSREQALAPARHGPAAFTNGCGAADRGAYADPWGAYIVVGCNDGKLRRAPAEPAFFPLADGIPGRVALLKGFGNALVPQVAAEFIAAFEEASAAAS